jgi:tripartite-type tricarboxylate transporter receptor subunit TctC
MRAIQRATGLLESRTKTKCIGLVRVIAIAFCSVNSAFSECAAVENASEFFRQKTIRFIVTYEPGGSYDLYARLATAHLGRHIPGNPSIQVQYMPGAGGLIGILHLFEKAQQDGTEIAILPRDLAVNQRLHPETARYDARKFNWIGTLSSYAGVMYVASRTGVKAAEGLRRIAVVAGSWGPTTETFITPTLLNALAGTKFKIVTGYRGGPDVDLAVERGEVDARMSSWTLLKSQRANWLREGFVVIPFQAGIRSHPDLPNVPLIASLANTEEGRRIFEFQNSDSGIGWSMVAPPNLAPGRLALLRQAFDAMTADPEFRADAQKRGLELVPASGRELEEIVERTIATPAEALTKLKQIIETP